MELDLNQKEEYKETELGLLPKDWEVVRLGDVVEFNLGRTPKRAENSYWNEGKYPWVSIADMKEFGFIYTTNEKVSQLAFDKIFNGHIVPKDTLLMSFKLTIGRTSILKIDAFHNEAIISIYPKNRILKEFLFYILPIIDFSNYYDSAIKGKTLNKSKIKKLLIPLPPLSEQKKIAYILSIVQEAKEKTEDVIKATKELKKSMMNHLFTYGPVSLEEAEKVPLKETEIGLMPQEWEMNTFGNVGTFQYGYTESANKKEVGPKFLRITDINLDTNIINWATVPYCKIEEDRFAYYSLNEGDILIARIGATTGKTCIIKNPPKSVFASYLIRFISNRDIIDPNFLFYYTEDYKYWRQIDAGKEGKLKKGVSSSQLKKFLLPVPSLLTQKKIASILSAIDQKIEAEESKKKALEDLFKSLLHNLMTAKIRVNHLEKVFDE